jgi:hypothetical protein
VRSIRYPGLAIPPSGGGTTDYARYFHKALADKKKRVLLSSETKMPMMYMDDAIAATIKLCKRQQNRLKSVPLITGSNELHTNRNSSRDQKHT